MVAIKIYWPKKTFDEFFEFVSSEHVFHKETRDTYIFLGTTETCIILAKYNLNDHALRLSDMDEGDKKWH